MCGKACPEKKADAAAPEAKKPAEPKKAPEAKPKEKH
jgi:hypothetical protein